MGWFRKKKEAPATILQASRENHNPFAMLGGYVPLAAPEIRLYESIREGVPLIDAAILKTVRLVGGFTLKADSKKAQRALDELLHHVNVGGTGVGLESFVSVYLDNLLTYGNAIGEMVLGEGERFLGLYNADVSAVRVKPAEHALDVDFYVQDGLCGERKVSNKNLVLFTALNPKAGTCTGVSILRSLPFVTDILFKIYHSVGLNFDRIGNIRYAVTYKPSGDGLDKTYAKERAAMIAREWADGMKSAEHGQVKDFITVGDVEIKVIGADNQLIDTEVPVRQMMEQIVAKLGIPPFLLGLSWSTTERMSKQQTDILTTELEYYRRLLTPVLLKIARTYLRLQGILDEPAVEWSTINLKDEVEAAQAHWYEAQACALEQEKGE